jgi:K+ transporter
LVGILKALTILAALSPSPEVTHLWSGRLLAFVVIGGAFLAVTGRDTF